MISQGTLKRQSSVSKQQTQQNASTRPMSSNMLITSLRPTSSVAYSRKNISMQSPTFSTAAIHNIQSPNIALTTTAPANNNPFQKARNMSSTSNYALSAAKTSSNGLRMSVQTGMTKNSSNQFISGQTNLQLSQQQIQQQQQQSQLQQQHSIMRVSSAGKFTDNITPRMYASSQQINYNSSNNNNNWHDGVCEISSSYVAGDSHDEQYLSQLQNQIEEDRSDELSIESIIKLYESKCLDIKLDVAFPQLLKFVDRIKMECINGQLNLQEQSLGQSSARVIANILSKPHSFSTLNLARNQICDDGAQMIAQTLFNNPSIAMLDVSNNNLSPLGSQYFFELLLTTESIYSLNISSPKSYNRNKMNISTAKVIAQALAQNQIISFLDISHSQLGSQGLHQLVKGLKQNRGLLSLNLAFNELGPDCGMLLSPALLNNRLLELNLSHNRIGNQSLEKIGEVIRSGQGVFAIEILDLSFNEIDSDGLSEFIATLAKNQRVKRINFDGNAFQESIGENVSLFFTQNNSLTHFSAKNCQFHADFVQTIAIGLKRNEGLQSLDLSHNYIGDEGAAYLAEALVKDNFNLRELILARCNIQEQGGLELAKVILTHPRLERIDVSHNLMSEQAGTFISANIRTNWNITFFDIEKNYIRYDQFVEINKLVKRNIEFKKAKQPAFLLTALSGLKSSEIRSEDLDRRKNDLNNREKSSQQVSSEINNQIEEAEQNLANTEAIAKDQANKMKLEMEGIMKELKEQDMQQNVIIKDQQYDMEQQFEHTQNIKKEIEIMKKEIKLKSTETIQRRNLLKTQVAFQKRILREEEQKVKSEDMGYEMFLSNVQALRKRVEQLQAGRLPTEASELNSNNPNTNSNKRLSTQSQLPSTPKAQNNNSKGQSGFAQSQSQSKQPAASQFQTKNKSNGNKTSKEPQKKSESTNKQKSKDQKETKNDQNNSKKQTNKQ